MLSDFKCSCPVYLPKLIQLEKEHGSIDAFYQKSISEDSTLKALVKLLSAPHSDYKLAQIGEALTAEYLKKGRLHQRINGGGNIVSSTLRPRFLGLIALIPPAS